MNCSIHDSNQALINQSDESAIRVLGETGQTVVYIFPDGRGMAEREQPDFDALDAANPSATCAETQLLEEMVAAGKMSAAQKTVVIHDQQTTGMTIAEILIARGWM